MIRKIVHISFATLTALLLFASTGAAQTFDVAGGYAWLREEDLTVPGGWFGAAGFNLNDSFAVFGQYSQHSKTLDVSGVDVDTKLAIYGGGAAHHRQSAVWRDLFRPAAVGRREGHRERARRVRHRRLEQQLRASARRRRGPQGWRGGWRPHPGRRDADQGGPEWQTEWVIMVGIVFRGGD